ncbi:MAG: hypothetical protein MUF81_15985 [Verrucomicrobia bacterium]|jgi:hypothetical protein|nr:hypothetical protein [Verrucomicrobiota bacterium]
MKLQTLFVAMTLVTFRAAAQDAVDPFMGDWQGSVSIGGQKQPVSVCMIPLDKGRPVVAAASIAEYGRQSRQF